uniref:Uncharacterized protein n=1 Tax=viral metagenome TaxID=1070528 RepID=A0A6H1Z812_9ZZZZ
MGNEANSSANSIIAEALQKAGVPPRNIELTPEVAKVEPTSKTNQLPSLDGLPKGQVMGEEQEPEETAVSEPEPSKAESGKEPEPQQLSKAEIDGLINQASSKFQSIMDTKINRLQAQMQGTVNALNQFFQAQEDSSLAGLPENEQITRRLERLEKGGAKPRIEIQQPIEQQPAPFYQYLANFVDATGLRIDDNRIDWAKDTNDPQVGFNRFLGSIKKALVEDQTKAIQELKNNGDREIQKIRKKTGVDKVSVTGPSGQGLPDIDKLTPFQKLEYAFAQQEIANKT